MKKLFLPSMLILLGNGSMATAQEDSDPYAVDYLNEHGSELHGKRITVAGFLRAGVDGHDPLCLLSTSRRKDGLLDFAWVEAQVCQVLADEGEYRAERATVTGVVSFSEDGYFVSPVVVHSILREAVVAWGR